MDVVFLSRMQFALTSMFHYIFPPLSIGLSVIMVIMELIYLKTKDERYKRALKFWVKVFALTFSLGVASGIVQLFSFGTNWASYSHFVGDVFGSALAAEGVFAFATESGFLTIVLFGWKRVKPGVHFLATVMVSFAAHFSAFWIVAANSWMQTPVGYLLEGEGVEQRAVVTDFWQMILNPSTLDRITHVLLGCWLSGAFLVLSICAYYFWKGKYPEFTRKSFRIALLIATLCVLGQGASGDSSAQGVVRNQPEKFAAMEGLFHTQEAAPIHLFGLVDEEGQRVRAGIEIPGALSFLAYHDFSKAVRGLEEFPRENWPPVGIVFQAYHLMILMWVLMFIAVVWAWVQWKRGRLAQSKYLLRFLMLSVLFPQIANMAGWCTAEVGRQPWVVYQLLRTSEGVSKAISAHQVGVSLLLLGVLFVFLLALFLFLLDRKIKHGPDGEGGDLYRDIYEEKRV